MVTGAREQADTRAVRWRPRSRACRRSRRARLPAWTSTETDFERASRLLWRRAARGPRPSAKVQGHIASSGREAEIRPGRRRRPTDSRAGTGGRLREGRRPGRSRWARSPRARRTSEGPTPGGRSAC